MYWMSGLLKYIGFYIWYLLLSYYSYVCLVVSITTWKNMFLYVFVKSMIIPNRLNHKND